MALTRRIARPLLGATFIVTGLEAVRDPGGPGPDRPAPPWIAERLPDPRHLVRMAGVAQIGAGALLAAGRLRRLAALTLVASIVPTTYVGHRYWEEDPRLPVRDMVHDTLRKAGLVGALLVTAFDVGPTADTETAGPPARHLTESRDPVRAAA